MATVYGTVYGKVRSSTEKQCPSPPSGAASKIIAEYLAAALATASTINMLTVPAGCSYRVKELNHGALGAGTSVTGGRAGATAEQLASVPTDAAGVIPANDGFWRYVSADEDVLLTTVGTMTGRIQLEVEFVRGNVATNQ